MNSENVNCPIQHRTVYRYYDKQQSKDINSMMAKCTHFLTDITLEVFSLSFMPNN